METTKLTAQIILTTCTGPSGVWLVRDICESNVPRHFTNFLKMNNLADAVWDNKTTRVEVTLRLEQSLITCKVYHAIPNGMRKARPCVDFYGDLVDLETFIRECGVGA